VSDETHLMSATRRCAPAQLGRPLTAGPGSVRTQPASVARGRAKLPVRRAQFHSWSVTGDR